MRSVDSILDREWGRDHSCLDATRYHVDRVDHGRSRWGSGGCDSLEKEIGDVVLTTLRRFAAGSDLPAKNDRGYPIRRFKLKE
jgi:hypothetical protein